MIRIDGTTYNVPVESLKRTADFLDKYTERTEDGVLRRELIGVYFNYKLTFGFTTDRAEYARLWEKLTEPEEFHTVIVPDEGGDYIFSAYFKDVGDELLLQRTGANYFSHLTVNFIAQAPARS